MNTTFTFKNVDVSMKEDMEAYALSKLDDLERYFGGVPTESIIVKVTLESMEKHTALRANISIDVRHGKEELFQAEEVKHTYTEALDSIKDMLAKQISTRYEKRKDETKLSSIRDVMAELEEKEEEIYV